MQLIASILALAALSTATPHLHHLSFHQKKSPMPDTNEALVSGLSETRALNRPAIALKVAPAAASVAAPVVVAAAPIVAAAAPVVASTVNTASSAVNNLAVDVSAILSKANCLKGKNSQSNNGGAWLGSDSKWTNTFTNTYSQAIVLVIWGNVGSWVNAIQPHITINLAPGTSQTVSFADGQSGAWAGIYPDTASVNGQISNTWGEYTFNKWSTVDVSREVNMSGHGMKIETPNCVSDMNTCVFTCNGGVNVCTTGYSLQNCANGSQKGATYGQYAGADSGGCGNMGDGAALKTTFS